MPIRLHRSSFLNLWHAFRRQHPGYSSVLCLSASCLALAGLSGPLYADDSAWTVFTRAESFSYSDGSPVTAYIDFLIGPPPKPGAEVAFTRNLFELGMRYQYFELSFIHRNDYNLYFTPDAAEFAYLNKNRKNIAYDQRYNVDVLANQYQLTGAKIGLTMPMGKNMEWKAAYAQYYASESVAGYLGKGSNEDSGWVAVTEREDFGQTRRTLSGDLYTDYHFKNDPLFQSDTIGDAGQGYSLDLSWVWHILPDLDWQIKAFDVLGEINWKDLPHMTASATSDSFVTTEDGRFKVQSNFSGRETKDDFTQKLTKREMMLLDYEWRHILIGYQYDHMSRRAFHKIKAGYRFSDAWSFYMAGEMETGALELHFDMPAGSLYFMTDDLNIDHAGLLAFGWNIGYRF